MHFDLPVGNVASRNLVYCSPDDTLAHAAHAMRTHQCSSILVKDNHKIIGIWTEADTIKLNFNRADIIYQSVGSHMTSPVESVPSQTRIGEVVALFRRKGFRHCLVDYPDGSQGIMSQTDITLNINVDHFLTLYKVKTVQELCLTMDSSLAFAKAVDIMRLRQTDAAVVIDAHAKPIGIITQADLVKVIANGNISLTLEHVALKDLIVINKNDSLLAAREALSSNRIRHLVVTNDEGRVEGMLSMRHILHFLQLEYSSQLQVALSKRDEALKQSMQDLNLAERVFEFAMEGIIITGPEGQIIRTNPAFTLLTGYSEEDVVGQTMSILASGKHDPAFYGQMWHSLKHEGKWSGEIWNKRKNGELFLEWLTITAVYNEFNDITHYTGLFRDVTEHREQEEQIRHLAYFDELTSLPNRRLLKDRVSLAIASAHRKQHQLAVMFIDLDQFKRINDNFGHSCGDDVLVELADRLKRITREDDTLARLGGDEFVILMPMIHSYKDISTLGKRINHVLKEPFQLTENQTMHVTTSIGASVYPDDGSTVEDLLKNADTAMYSVKANGRNGLQLFQEEMAQRSMQHFTLEAALRNAIDNHELEVHYQPKVDVKTGAICSSEALLRWTHPELGHVSPAKFIPLAEENGLIESIDQWVMNQVCQQLKQWQTQGIAVTTAINVSPISLRHRNLVKEVKDLLNHYDIQPELLQLEITESAFIDDIEGVATQLKTLNDFGVTVALDDFGTGYSSLSYLALLPINELKIDGSFIQNIPDCKNSDMLFKAITGMAKNLKLKVVVEGVETQRQLDYVKQLGCDVVQGYLTGRPSTASVLEAALLKQNALETV
ncbi:EAL domain-containing protein [Litoribacillus peritrichatus]|uniref:Histidine kinase n=1 Tax=Litoribacillus peritrichatus TaxID=718191 RepID=A0ABP7MPJ9_9GAMM